MRSTNRLASRVLRFSGSSGSLCCSKAARSAGSLGGVAQPASMTAQNKPTAQNRAPQGEAAIFTERSELTDREGDARSVEDTWSAIPNANATVKPCLSQFASGERPG